MTIADRALIDEVGKHQKADMPIRVSRFLGVVLPESLTTPKY